MPGVSEEIVYACCEDFFNDNKNHKFLCNAGCRIPSGKIRVNAKPFGNSTETLVFCPQECGWIEIGSRNQVRINQTDALTIQTAGLDHLPHFAGLRHLCLWQQVQKGKCACAIPQRPQGQFRNNIRMHDNAPVAEQLPKFVVT